MRTRKEPLNKVNTATLKVVAFDPGTRNFAFCAARYRSKDNKVEYKIDSAGKLQHTVYDLKSNLLTQYRDYLEEVSAIFQQYTPDIFVIERFMNRGARNGSGEPVNMMIALAIEWLRVNSPQTTIYLVTSASWKNASKRMFPLEKAYRYALVEPHELDAALMSGYGYSLFNSIQPYTWCEKKSVQTFIQRLECVATGKKKRRRLA